FGRLDQLATAQARVGEPEVGGAFFLAVLRVAAGLGRERGAFVFHFDLHGEKPGARGGGREGLGDVDQLPGFVRLAGGERGFRGGEHAISGAHLARLGKRVARIEVERSLEQVDGVLAGGTDKVAALQGGLGLREYFLEPLLARLHWRRRGGAGRRLALHRRFVGTLHVRGFG